MEKQHKTSASLCRRMIVCGDDFGMNADIDYGMLELAHMRRLSAVSCLVQGPTFKRHAEALASSPAEVGLHLNLTENFGDVTLCGSLRTLVFNCYARRVNRASIDRILQTQFDLFEQTLGCMPAYIDGHQHVHQFPVVRERLLVLMRQRYGVNLPWLRYTAPGGQRGIPLMLQVKASVIGALGSGALRVAAARYGIRMNRRLLGVYDFCGGRDRYARLLQSWLNNAQDGDLLMCHPALREGNDALGPQRAAEFTVLSSAEVGDWMCHRHIEVMPFAQWETSRQHGR
jgi:predicted glycoside hydrolase/deacetylase ChbG (UPF0249 family)